MDNGAKILKEILERVKNLSKEEYLQLYQEAIDKRQIMPTLEKTCNWKLIKKDTNKVTYHSACGLDRTFVNGKIYNLYKCPKCGRKVKKGK